VSAPETLPQSTVAQPALERAVELTAQARAVMELSAIATREHVRAARRYYLEALLVLAPPIAAGERLPLRRLSQRVERLIWRARWTAFWQLVYGQLPRRLALLGLSTGALASLVAALALGPNLLHPDLLEGRHYEISSSWAKCEPARSRCGGSATNIFFHTNEEPEPFIRYDLGRLVGLRRVEVTNRRDGNLWDRALPLVIQTSLDGKTWHEVARRDYWFDVWRADFPRTEARYLKLFVARRSLLHLERVRAWE
jgi:hypothetical protein